VAGAERDLLDPEAGLEQAAGAFVAQVVEVQVLDPKRAAGPGEDVADGLRL
jgi:hypothetical protein